MRTCIKNRLNIDKSGEIIFLDQFVSWKKLIYEIETELNIEGKIKYVIYQTPDSYRVQAVNVKGEAFKQRLPLKKEWRGLGNEELKKASGLEKIVFCHHSGFIGGGVDYETALKMA